MQSRILQAQKVLNQKKSNPNRAVQLLTPVVQDELTPWQAYHLYGQAMLKKKEYSKAMDYLKRALYMGSEDVGTYYSLSLAAYHLKRFKESELYAEKAVKVREDHFEAWMKLGDSKKELGKLNEALGSFQKCNQIDPKKAEVAVKIGHIYRDQGYSDKAIEMYEIAIKMDRGQLNAINEKVKILTNQKRFDEALKSIESGLGIQPDNIVLQVTCAELKKEMGEYAQAIKIYEGILKKKPNYGGVRVNYANILQELGRFDEAERNYLRANKDFPALMESFSNYLFVQHYNPSKTKEEIFEAHKKWDSIYAPDHPERAEPVDQDRDRPLRIGLISGGFRKHPVGWMILPGLEKIDRDQYELYFYSNYSLVDEVTKKLHSISHKWHMVKALDDEKLNKLIREDQIDILIDLSGHAAESRLRTVAMEPAPVIVKWVGGLINTTGLKSIDFLLSDSIETPDGVEPFYLEKLVRMPDDYICYRAPEYAPEVGENPFKMNGFITFGCFNNPIKVNPELLGVWAEIMKKVPNSKLFLKSKQYGNKVYVERIQTIMDKYGIEPERLIFEGLSPHAELLQTYNRIDIALDPWPYSGGLTTCEAMWMGIPVITKPGDTFAGRHSATHVFNAGFKEWICNNWDEYIHQSVLLASDPVTLSDLRKGLRDRVASSPLCDSDRYAAHLEKAFRQMWYQRIDGYEKGLNKDEWSDHIRVEPIKESTSDSNKFGKSISESPTNRYRFDRNGDLSTEPVDSSISRLKVNHSNHNGKILADHETLSQFKTDDGITICTPDDHTLLTRYVLEEQKNWYEAELSFIKNFVKPGMTILDIGAGFGVYTLPIAKKIGNSGSVYSFEPSPMLNRYLEKSIKINGFNQIELINLAVTDQVGKQQFEADSQNPENGQLNPEGEVEVMTTTLDAWWQLNGLPNIDLIKIDVNGMELNVLKGAENLLSKNSPFLLIAVPNSKDQMDAIIKYLNSIDYELYQYISQLRLLARYEIEQEKDVYLNNLVAVKKDLVPSLIDQGLIFDDVVEIGKPASDTWMKVFNRFKWSSDKISAWETALNKTDAVYYKRALNYIATALELNIETDHKNRSAKAKYLLGAAQLMIELYNGGLDQNISISLSLSRVLNDLGRRGQAVSVLKNVIDQQQKNGKSSNEVNLPFYLPIHSQDDSEIKTDFDKWLMVRIVEAWLLLKDQSSYFSGDTEHRMLQLLDGNPETGAEINQRISVIQEVSKNEMGNKIHINGNGLGQTELTKIPFNKELWQAATEFKEALDGRKMVFIPNGHGGNYGVIQGLQNQLFDHFRLLGIDVAWTSHNSAAVPNPKEISEYILQNCKNAVYYTGIYWYDLSVRESNGSVSNLFDHMDIPVISTLGDHPYTSFMLSRVKGSSKGGLITANWKSITDEYKFFQPNRKFVYSLNQGADDLCTIGPTWTQNRYVIPHHKREVDLLIPLGLAKFSEQQEEKCLNDSQAAGSEYHKFTKKVLHESLTDYENSILDIAKNVHQMVFGFEWEIKSEWSKHDKSLISLIGQVDWVIRQKRRKEMIHSLLRSEELRTLKIAITLPESMKSILPDEVSDLNMIYLGILPHEKLINMYGNSRFVLHSNLTFPDAVHERVRMASISGSAIISDPSPGLRTFHGIRNSMIFREYGESFSDIDFSISSSETLGKNALLAAGEKTDENQYLKVQLSSWTQYLMDRN